MIDATILGGTGFIGSHLVAAMRQRGYHVFAPHRDADLTGADLGTVFYCMGLTADFRGRPFDTVTAHVGKLNEVLRQGRFDRLVYLSSTRLYLGSAQTGEEDDLRVNPHDPSDLYDISKAMGESLALSCGRPVRIARLSNVYGADLESENFLTSILRAALREGVVTMQTGLDSTKDYIHVTDVVDLLIRIGSDSRHRTYNVASGQNVSHRDILQVIRTATGCEVRTTPQAPVLDGPPIRIDRLREEFAFHPALVLDRLPALVEHFRRHLPRPGPGTGGASPGDP